MKTLIDEINDDEATSLLKYKSEIEHSDSHSIESVVKSSGLDPDLPLDLGQETQGPTSGQ